MRIRKAIVTLLIFLAAWPGYALEPEQILIIANSDVAASVRIARYYCTKRKVPADNILALPLGTGLSDTIIRDDYEKQLAEPIRKKLSSPEFAGKIRCLLTTYGVPIKVGPRGILKGAESELRQLKIFAEQEKNKIEQLEPDGSAKSAEQKKTSSAKLAQLQSRIDHIVGKETDASVDSESSMVLFGPSTLRQDSVQASSEQAYELYRWQLNELKSSVPYWNFKTLMVCRLDGPDEKIARGLVDKAIAAEKTGLKGIAYIDSRGIRNKRDDLSAYFDQSLRNLAVLTRLRTELPVREERTEKLFEPGACPRTAIYCGWYSLKKYIDAFDFADGAIGYHISSLEAVDIRDPNSSQWCPAMLADGITATLGAVAEPYLRSFPEPAAFFTELFKGRCLVEAYYRTKPFNSWQLVLIGDPLYRPFKKP